MQWVKKEVANNVPLPPATYIYLINFREFPALEYANAALMLGLALFLWLVYPWNLKQSGG